MEADINNSSILNKYKEAAMWALSRNFPTLSYDELDRAINWSINNRFSNVDVTVHNNYKNQIINTNLHELANFILDKKPIITSYGVLFSRHGTVPNPIYKMIDNFINSRDSLKHEMFKYPKGSEQYEMYNLLQSLAKIDVNGFYGACGKHSCIYYNLHVASSTTTQGRSCISAAALLFESILNNNVPFGSLNELITFIRDVCEEKRTFQDNDILDRDITVSECFFKLMASTGFGWVPSEKDMMIVWDILLTLSHTDINRIFYKNNLFNFMDNKNVIDTVIYMLSKLDEPYMDPNGMPKEIAKEYDVFYDLITEYVYYDKQIIDRLEKMNSLIRSVSIIQDTDSAIVSLDGWYRYVLEKVQFVPLKIKNMLTDVIEFFEKDSDDEVVPSTTIVREYSFLTEEMEEIERETFADKIIPQDGLRYSIINIMAHTLSGLVNDYMHKYTINSNSASPDRPCLLFMKNEFLMKRVLTEAEAKKHYASNQELQEGHRVPKEEALDVKGMDAFVKSTMNPTTKAALKRVLFEEILDSQEIDQVAILRRLAEIERGIYESIINGEKLYYKPARIKSFNGYEDPMRIQGIKASFAYNSLHEEGTEAINLEVRNSIDIIKVEITKKTVEKIRETFPNVYEKAMKLLQVKEYKDGIDAIAIPLNEPVPNWVLPFVKYYEIINDNIGLFPLESVGLFRGGNTNNYTNIIQF